MHTSRPVAGRARGPRWSRAAVLPVALLLALAPVAGQVAAAPAAAAAAAAAPAHTAPAAAPGAHRLAAARSVTIVDDGDALSSSEESRIRSAAASLPSDVRLFVVTADLPSGELTDWLADRGSAVGWSGSGVARDVLLLAVSVSPSNRKMDAHWGSGVDLNPYEEDVFSAMSPRFRQGDWGAGLLAGVQTAAAALDGELSPGTTGGGNDSDSSPGVSRSFMGWVVLAIVVVVVLANVLGKLRTRRRERQAAERETARRAQVAAENLSLAGDLRARLDQDQLLVPSIPDSPLQDQLELDLQSAQSDLRMTDAAADPDAAAKDLAGVAQRVATLDRRIALLRKAPGWEVAWSEEVAAARTVVQQWIDGVQAVKRLGAAPTTGEVPPQASSDLDTIESGVRGGTLALETGLGQLMTVERTARARLHDITEQRGALERAQQEAARRAEAERQAAEQQSSGGGFDLGSAGIGYWLGRSTSRRRGGFWGGGWSGGGWSGGSSWGSSRRSGGGSRSFGGGGFSRGGGSRGGGGGGSRSF